ncbi:tRNA guanosine(34) transglycosylase Tgt [bacterium]|nr:tRNA guanosine(34) transglycosylase Tgt [bacterium]
MVSFELQAVDSKTGARAGILHTAHGDIPTPVFMPVGTQGTVKTIPWRDLIDFDTRIILSNTYHLFLRPGHELIARLGGIHKFIGWNRAILTDSGGFQVFSLSDLRKITDEGVMFQSHHDGSYHFFTPQRAIEVEYALRPDIMMSFDQCTDYPISETDAEVASERTFQWAKQGYNRWQQLVDDDKQVETAPSLFGIIQGGVYPNLRKNSAEQILSIDFPGYAIGGLSVGEPKQEMFEMLKFLLPIMPSQKPRYLMGVGKPEDIINAVALGADMFDCVLPTRNARNASVYTWNGKMSLKAAYYAEDTRPIDENCGCYTCQNYSRAYIRHLFSAGELLAPYLATHHALYFFMDFMRKIRQSILDGNFYDFMMNFFENFDPEARNNHPLFSASSFLRGIHS